MSFNPSQYRVPKGAAGGGRWGAPRDASAAKAQKDVPAQHMYTQVMKTPQKKQGAYVKGLSDQQLEKLTSILYSSRTSDPAVVAARIAVANEMSKRGLDIKKYGALGGGVHGKLAPVVGHHSRASRAVSSHHYSHLKAAPKKAAPVKAAAPRTPVAHRGASRAAF